MAKSDQPDDRKRELVQSLTVEERAALPSRLRALVADDATVAWNQAKAERDAALEAAEAEMLAAIETAEAERVAGWAARRAAEAADAKARREDPDLPYPVLPDPEADFAAASRTAGERRIRAVAAARTGWKVRKAELLAEQEG